MTAWLLLLACLQSADEKEALRRAEEALREFRAAIAAPKADDAAKIAAVKKLGEVRHTKTMQALGLLLAAEGEAICITAAQALGRFKDVAGTAGILAAALDDPSNRKRRSARIAIVRAIGDVGDESALPTLHDIVEENDYELAAEAVVSCAKIPHVSSVPILIKALRKAEKDPESMERGPAAVEGAGGLGSADEDQRKDQARRKALLHQPLLRALRAITKEKHATHHDWLEWWKRSAATFKVERK